MKQAETTIVEISSDIFDDRVMIIEGYHDFVVQFTYPEGCDKSIPIVVEMLEDNQVASKVVLPGDTYTAKHTFKAKFTKDITKDHAFPITFKMDGQKYILNRTKQNKLILTK
jgi:stalled ribosome rescue protein Dom34